MIRKMISKLKAPTPKFMRKLGNALVTASQGIAVPMVLSDMKLLAVGVMVAGWVGKFITELYSTDEAQIDSQPGME